MFVIIYLQFVIIKQKQFSILLKTDKTKSVKKALFMRFHNTVALNHHKTIHFCSCCHEGRSILVFFHDFLFVTTKSKCSNENHGCHCQEYHGRTTISNQLMFRNTLKFRFET